MSCEHSSAISYNWATDSDILVTSIFLLHNAIKTEYLNEVVENMLLIYTFYRIRSFW